MTTKLEKSRDSKLDWVEKMNKWVRQISADTTYEQCKVRLERLEIVWNEICEIEDKLLEAPNVESIADEWEETYFDMKSKLLKSMTDKKPNSNVIENIPPIINQLFQEQRSFIEGLNNVTQNANKSSIEIDNIQLPKVSIQSFDGTYRNWPSFEDSFISSVHDNNSISNTTKFKLLKRLLSEGPLSLVKNMLETDANYTEAWDKLVSRYRKNKHILSSYITTFIDLPPAVSGKANDIRALSDRMDEILIGIKTMGSAAEYRDAWLIQIILRKLDDQTRQAWIKESIESEYPTTAEFLKFLNTRCDSLDDCFVITDPKPVNAVLQNSNNRNKKSSIRVMNTTISDACSFCKREGHVMSRCFKFRYLNSASRRATVKKLGVCERCLKTGHNISSCTDTSTCRHCNQIHHTLLHDFKSTASNHQSTSSNQPNSSHHSTYSLPSTLQSLPIQSNPQSIHLKPISENNVNNTPEAHCAVSSIVQSLSIQPVHPRQQVFPCISLLPTALIYVFDRDGNRQLAHALLDSGSQSSFIAESLVQRLRLPRFHSFLAVSGISNAQKTSTRGFSSITITSRYSNVPKLNVNAFILSSVLHVNPENLNLPNMDNFRSWDLADPKFNETKDIEILLGSDVFFDILNPQKIIVQGRTHAQSTLFGWILLAPPIDDFRTVNSASTVLVESDVNQTLQRFWELEEPPTSNAFTPDEEQCESHFRSNLQRDSTSGRYIVKLPFRGPYPKLGFSKSASIRRLMSMERRFDRDPSLKAEYIKFMSEYLSLGHMELISTQECQIDSMNPHTFYLPHHAVFKLESSTTKVRVVFDGSSKASSGHSLNESLLTGPTIQDDLVTIISRFRCFPIVFSADVEKMYRQVLVAKPDDDYQRIVWRFSPEDQIESYRLRTVTYGTSSAPFLAIRVLHQIADDCREKHPDVADIIQNNFYVDDLLSGADDVSNSLRLLTIIQQVLEQYGFPLRKWKSNSKQILDAISNEMKDPSTLDFNDDSNDIKTLGLRWNPQRDVFSFFISQEASSNVLTKRKLLSEVSKVFDPLGWLSPVSITFKLLFQRLWALKLNWDDTLPDSITDHWLEIKNSLSNISKIEIPRHIHLYSSSTSVQIHGFSDASELAYSAVVYLRVCNHDEIRVSLLIAKTKVAPMKQISLPRLELCGALLLTKLLTFSSKLLSSRDPKLFAWTDSEIVLSWLSDHPRRWKTFVANRTSEILSHTSREIWSHVKSSDNPADCASRGLSPSSLPHFDLWWSGPTWLAQPTTSWPSSTPKTPVDLPEVRKSDILVNIHVVENESVTFLLNKWSSLHKIKRVLSFILQFVFRPSNETHFVDYYVMAEKFLIKQVQAVAFLEEIKSLKENKCLNSRNNLLALSPFIDDEGILRVGGRLENSSCPAGMKHPIILPKSHRLTYLIVHQSHLQNLHPGPSLQCSLLKQRFWILDSRNVVRSYINRCVKCFRQKKMISQQLMGNLPSVRITPSRPFRTTGVDYAGPIFLKTRHGRGKIPITKGYICLFICMSTKAVHIELASDMTADTFLAALRRFASRRGVPNEIVADNGTNFKASRKELEELYHLFKNVHTKALISSFCSQRQIKFRFIPARAPHFGGLWESNIKGIKHHLRRVTINATLTFEEMLTLLCQIEAVLNSRPLCPMTTDVDDLTVLTPGHFLMGEAPTTIPEPPLKEVPTSHLSRWQNVQHRVQGFWQKWSLDYLHTLQHRPKWRNVEPNLMVNDMVIIREDDLPPAQWSLGRVIELHPGEDNLVRVVTVRTKNGTLRRPIVKLCKIPLDQPSFESVNDALTGGECSG